MKILVSNDDGILSNGIRALIESLSLENEVYVVAPDNSIKSDYIILNL